MVQDLDTLLKSFQEELKPLNKKADILSLKAHYLGKKGHLSEILKSLKDASAEVRKELGSKGNLCKDLMEKATSEKLEAVEILEMEESLDRQWVDLSGTNSQRDLGLTHGAHHPLHAIQREVEDIFLSMGFDVLDGPHIEDDYHNFEALNIPRDHPARDMQDTFWFADGEHLLRTHTSTIQVRGMEARKPPYRFVGPGKVFRCERTDASHESVFHQIEGMMVDENVSVAHLIYFMKTLLSEVFKKVVEVRLRPGFFPFVEPGFELDIKCLICAGKGCSVCKQSGWVELLPCGMVHPNVLAAGKVDSKKYSGFAFGLGLDRLVMMKHGIEDIRHIHGGDLRFISQFAEF